VVKAPSRTLARTSHHNSINQIEQDKSCYENLNLHQTWILLLEVKPIAMTHGRFQFCFYVRCKLLRQGSFFNGIDVNQAYLQTTQMATFTRILGSAESAKRYLDPSISFYLSRGHLAPDSDFVDAASQDITYYYINCAPQWQAVNNGNWKALETTVRNLASGRMADYTIYTGTFGILTLADIQGRQKPITLASNGKFVRITGK
jgi:hypothetical protein